MIKRMLWLFIFGLSTSTWALKNESSFQCHDNQWLCGTQCIHQRSFCTLSGTCHPDFPRPCGDGERCYHRLENCWNAACLNSNCQRDANLDGVDKNQVNFLEQCPKVEDRFAPCSDPHWGQICFYGTEWVCGEECIGKKDVCLKQRAFGHLANNGCDFGMKRCGEKCVDRQTPCNGHCWADSAVHKCGNNMCLSQYQLQDYHVCNGTCYDHTVPCNGSCQSTDFYMCDSGDQCYRYWDHCDSEEHCDDASDEGGACKAREYIVYLVPILMLLFIGSLVVMLICLRVRGCEFDFLLPFRTNQADSSGSANGFVRNQSQMPDGEMVVMTDIVDVLPHNGSNNNSRLRSGNYV